MASTTTKINIDEGQKINSGNSAAQGKDSPGGADTDDVRRMYERYPYPSPIINDDLIDDVANNLGFLYPDDPLEGKRILDAGCGTGQRLLGAAKNYPKAEFWGLDMTETSLNVAKQLAAKHQLKNVHFIRADLLNLDVEQEFDIISSTGVIHHLEQPALGLKNLTSLLAKDGVINIWLYHTLGEYQRLLDRELLLALWGKEKDNYELGLSILRDLDLRLDTKRYGATSDQEYFDEINLTSIDVDAYMHPIVYAYRIDEALNLFDGCNVDWVAPNGINNNDYSKLLDLANADTSMRKFFNLNADELFDSPSLKQQFEKLGKREKLAVIELKIKPSGFTILAGRGRSIYKIGPRIIGNVLK